MYVCVPDPEVVGLVDPNILPKNLDSFMGKFRIDVVNDATTTTMADPPHDAYDQLARGYAEIIDPIWRARFGVANDVIADHHVDIRVGFDEQIVGFTRIIAKLALKNLMGYEGSIPWGRAGVPHKDVSVAELTPSKATYLTPINRTGTEIFTGAAADYSGQLLEEIGDNASLAEVTVRSLVWLASFISRLNRLGVSKRDVFQGRDREIVEMHPLAMHRNPRLRYRRDVTPVLLRDIVSIKHDKTEEE